MKSQLLTSAHSNPEPWKGDLEAQRMHLAKEKRGCESLGSSLKMRNKMELPNVSDRVDKNSK